MLSRYCCGLIGAIVVLHIDFAINAKEPSPTPQTFSPAEKKHSYLQRSKDPTTRHTAERYLSLIRLQPWADSSGKFTANAKYLEHDPDFKWVKLETAKGRAPGVTTKVVTLPLDKLSEPCQSRIHQIATLQKKLEGIEARLNWVDEKSGVHSVNDTKRILVDKKAIDLQVRKVGTKPLKLAEPFALEVEFEVLDPKDPKAERVNGVRANLSFSNRDRPFYRLSAETPLQLKGVTDAGLPWQMPLPHTASSAETRVRFESSGDAGTLDKAVPYVMGGGLYSFSNGYDFNAGAQQWEALELLRSLERIQVVQIGEQEYVLRDDLKDVLRRVKSEVEKHLALKGYKAQGLGK